MAKVTAITVSHVGKPYRYLQHELSGRYMRGYESAKLLVRAIVRQQRQDVPCRPSDGRVKAFGVQGGVCWVCCEVFWRDESVHELRMLMSLAEAKPRASLEQVHCVVHERGPSRGFHNTTAATHCCYSFFVFFLFFLALAFCFDFLLLLAVKSSCANTGVSSGSKS